MLQNGADATRITRYGWGGDNSELGGANMASKRRFFARGQEGARSLSISTRRPRLDFFVFFSLEAVSQELLGERKIR